jgi:hypothetical protein
MDDSRIGGGAASFGVMLILPSAKDETTEKWRRGDQIGLILAKWEIIYSEPFL